MDIRQMNKLILDGQKAGVRDPFVLTEAIRYDDYTNCFIHKGTSGHAEHGETCLIPGRPGEAPDEIQKLPDGKVRGKLVYRDFFFEKQASKFKFTAWVLEEARIRVLSEDENHKTILVDRVLPLPEKKGFCSYEAALEDCQTLAENYKMDADLYFLTGETALAFLIRQEKNLWQEK